MGTTIHSASRASRSSPAPPNRPALRLRAPAGVRWRGAGWAGCLPACGGWETAARGRGPSFLVLLYHSSVSRRKFPKRLWLSLLAVLVLTLLAAWIWVGSVERRLRQEVEARVLELSREIAARDPRRPCLFGETIPGDAWDDYLPAMKVVDKIPPLSCEILWNFAAMRKGHDPEKARAILPGLEPVLEAFKQGSRRSHAGRFVDRANSKKNREYLIGDGMRRLAAIAICGARVHFEQGNATEGVQLLLATAQSAGDVGLQSRGGLGIYYLFWNEALRLIQAGRFTEEASQTFVRGLEILEGSLPSFGERVRFQLQGWGERVLAGKNGNTGASSPPSPSWRHAYSSTIMEMQGFLNVDRWFQMGAAAEGLPWSEARPIWDSLEKESWTRGNPASQGIPFIYEAPRSHRDIRARWRLLRMAAIYTGSGDIVTLEDPYGDLLRFMLQGNELKIWTLARNGVDDGGTESPKNDKDIVIRVPAFTRR